MSRDTGKALAVLGIIVGILKALAGRKGSDIEWGTGWMWPVPTLYPPGSDNGYPATVSSGFDSKRKKKDGSGYRPHVGMDIMYRRREKLRDRPEYPATVKSSDGFVSGSTWFFAPPLTPILAARPGRIWSVQKRTDGGGWSVVIDHGAPWATYYTHLATVNVAEAVGGKRRDGQPPELVEAGTVIGTMGGNESDSERLRHLHFEMWYKGHGAESSKDAFGAGVMTNWQRKAWRPASLPT